MKVEFSDVARSVTAYYPKSQARLRVYAINRYDAEIAKSREYFMLELKGAAIVEPLLLDADDDASIDAIATILERFQRESKRSNELKVSMAKRKVAAVDELSREETKLVELQAESAGSATEIEKSKLKIASLKEEISLAEDLQKLNKISGPIGVAKLHLDRPAYEFIATMEPGKALYTLKAGYSFQVSDRDVKYYLDLLGQRKELKQRLLANEARREKLKSAVEEVFTRKEP